MRDHYITIAKYPNSAQANFDRDRLKKYGIKCFVSQNHALLEPLQQNHNENVSLNISRDDFDKATEILRK